MGDTETQPTEAELEQAEQNVPERPEPEDHGDAHDPDEDPRDEDPRDETKREAIKYRRQLRAAEKANDELRAENERLRQQIVEHEARAGDSAWRAAFIGAQVELAAARAGAKRPSMVTKLVPTDPLKQLETPEAIVTGAEAAVAETLTEAPELKGGSDGSLVTQGARSTPPAVRAQSPDQWIRENRRRR
jgi:hypothetical protein